MRRIVEHSRNACSADERGQKYEARSNLKKVAQTSRGLTLLGSRANEHILETGVRGEKRVYIIGVYRVKTVRNYFTVS